MLMKEIYFFNCLVTHFFAVPPTGRIFSGGDEEDPDHAGNSGERI